MLPCHEYFYFVIMCMCVHVVSCIWVQGWGKCEENIRFSGTEVRIIVSPQHGCWELRSAQEQRIVSHWVLSSATLLSLFIHILLKHSHLFTLHQWLLFCQSLVAAMETIATKPQIITFWFCSEKYVDLLCTALACSFFLIACEFHFLCLCKNVWD